MFAVLLVIVCALVALSVALFISLQIMRLRAVSTNIGVHEHTMPGSSLSAHSPSSSRGDHAHVPSSSSSPSSDDDPLHRILALRASTGDFLIRYGELVFGKLLGKGSQGEVFRASWRGSDVAVKKIDVRKVQPEIIEELCGEAEITKRLRHPALTLFMGVSLEHPHLCIVSEVVSRGSLFDIIP